MGLGEPACLCMTGSMHTDFLPLILVNLPLRRHTPCPSPSSLQLVEQQLYESLQLCQAEAAHLQHDAMHLISPRLVDALLGNHRGMTHRTKQAGAELVFLVRGSGLKLPMMAVAARQCHVMPTATSPLGSTLFIVK